MQRGPRTSLPPRGFLGLLRAKAASATAAAAAMGRGTATCETPAPPCPGSGLEERFRRPAAQCRAHARHVRGRGPPHQRSFQGQLGQT
eukprot:12845209-Prorocentrum_lima.AAC.1